MTSSNIYYVLMNQKRDLDLVETSLERNISQSKDLLINEMKKREKDNKDQIQYLKDLSTMLKKNEKNSNKNIVTLKKDIKDQQKIFIDQIIGIRDCLSRFCPEKRKGGERRETLE